MFLASPLVAMVVGRRRLRFRFADFCAEQLRDRALQVHHTLDQLHDWRPPATTRGRKPKA